MVKMQTNIMILRRGNCGRAKKPTLAEPVVATRERQATEVNCNLWKMILVVFSTV